MHTHCCGAWLCLQESHCSAVQALAFNLCDAGCRNLFATVGKDQVTTVYAIIECGWVFVYYKDASCSACLHAVMFAPCKHPSSMRFASNPSAVLNSFPAGAYAVSLPFTAPPMHRCCTGMPAGAIADMPHCCFVLRFMQATIYDDQHMSDHIAVVASLSLSDSIEQAQVCVLCCVAVRWPHLACSRCSTAVQQSLLQAQQCHHMCLALSIYQSCLAWERMCVQRS